MNSRKDKRKYKYMKDEKTGNKYFYRDNILHREKDLPAVIYIGYESFWYINGHIVKIG